MIAKTYQEIFDAMKTYIITHQQRATDFNEGSTIASLLEAVSRQLAAVYVAVVSNVDSYTRQFAARQFGLELRDGVAASGTVVFSAPSAASSTIIIPAGTKAGTAGGIVFETRIDGSIAAGQTVSAPVSVACTIQGKAGNVPAGAIAEMISSISGVQSVSNGTAMSGGSDAESKAAFDTRFSDFVVGLFKSSIPGIRASALAVPGVGSVGILEHFPPSDGFNVSVVAEDGSGTLPSAMEAALELVVLGDGTASNPGCMACGINGRVIAPTISWVDIDATLAASTSLPRAYIEADLIEKLTEYIDGLGIGVPVTDGAIKDILSNEFGIVGISSLAITRSAYIDAGTIGRARNIVIAMENP